MKAKFSPGKQREFLNEVLKKVNCPSLRELINRGVDVKYSSLKNYYIERRLLPLLLVENLCNLSGIDKNQLKFKILEENWGQIMGGEKTKSKD